MRLIRRAVVPAAMAAVLAGATVSRASDAFDKRMVEAGRWQELPPEKLIETLDQIAALAQEEDVAALSKAASDPDLRRGPILQHLVLARLAQKNGKAFDAFLERHLEGDRSAHAAVGVAEPEVARQLAYALHAKARLLENRVAAVQILSAVGGEGDLAELQKVRREWNPERWLADILDKSLDDLKFKLDKVKTDEERKLWNRKGLEFWYVRYSQEPHRVPRELWWNAGKTAAQRKWADLPLEMLQFQLDKKDPLATALAAHRPDREKFIPEFEKLAVEKSATGEVAKLSLATIATEEAVNACLRVSGVPEESGYVHQELAKFAAEKGGVSTLPILVTLSKDARLAEVSRAQYAQAQAQIEARLKSAATQTAPK